MKDTTELDWSTEEPILLMAGKGNYAMVAGKGTAARLRAMPQASHLSVVSEAALLAPLR